MVKDSMNKGPLDLFHRRAISEELTLRIGVAAGGRDITEYIPMSVSATF